VFAKQKKNELSRLYYCRRRSKGSWTAAAPGQFQRPRQGQLGGDLREVVQRQVPRVCRESPAPVRCGEGAGGPRQPETPLTPSKILQRQLHSTFTR